MSVEKKYPRTFKVRAVDASVMDVPAALVYGPGTARPACIAVTQLFLYSATWQTERILTYAEWPNQRGIESVALRGEVRVVVNVTN